MCQGEWLRSLCFFIWTCTLIIDVIQVCCQKFSSYVVSPVLCSSGVKILKKNKLKIDPSRAGAQRMVFDDEGVAMPPLAALAQESKAVLKGTGIDTSTQTQSCKHL